MRAVWWPSGIVVFGVLLVLAWRHGDDWMQTGQPVPLGAGPPVARLHLEGFGGIEVLSLGTGVFEDGEYREHQREGTTHHLGQPVRPVRVQSTFGRPTHVRTEFEPTELYLCLRADPRIDPAGWTYRRGAFVRDLARRKAIPSRSPADVPASAEVAPVVVQVEDGHSGWMTANGPLAPRGVDLPYYWMVFESWPRSPKTLTFRVAVPGQAPQEFSLPNPGHVPAPVVTSAPGIREITTPDYKVSISPRYEELPDYARVLSLHADAYREHRYARDVPYEVIRTELTGTYGNPIRKLSIDGLAPQFGTSRSGFPLAGDDARLEARVTVRATPDLGRALSEVTIVAEGVRDADGMVRVTRAFPATGVARASGGGEPHPHGPEEINFGIELQSSGDGAVDFSSGKTWWLYLFAGDRTTSTGRFSPPPRASNAEVRSSFVGVLEPGQRFRIGVAAPPAGETHRFFLDAP